MCIHISHMFQLDIPPSYICTHNLYKRVLHAMYLSCMYIYISWIIYAGICWLKIQIQLTTIVTMKTYQQNGKHVRFIYMYILSIYEVYLPWWVLNINLRSCSQSCQLESSLESEESWIRLNFMARFCVDAVRTARKFPRFSGNCPRFDFDNLIIDPNEVVAVATLRSVLPINRWGLRLMILLC